MKTGDMLPSKTFQATQQLQASLDDYRGQWLVLYFYPKDATPGCTLEGQDFRDAYEAFTRLNAVILGISRDNLACHERFRTKQGFPFQLVADSDEALCTLFDVIKMKNMYGKSVRGIERSTFLINPDGVIVREWRKVTVKGHVADVLSELKRLQGVA